MRFEMESVLPVLLISLVLVGMPAIILKQSTIWFLRAERNGPRLKLLWLSIGAAALAGLASIIGHAVLSERYEMTEDPVFHAVPAVEAVTALALLVLAGGAEALLWLRFTHFHGAQTLRGTAAWLIGGNLWIPWALLLMHVWRLSNGFID
jgi:hypothetical protein